MSDGSSENLKYLFNENVMDTEDLLSIKNSFSDICENEYRAINQSLKAELEDSSDLKHNSLSKEELKLLLLV